MEHPISELMQTAMSSMKDMVDVNTVVGHPVQASSGSTIIPISRVTFGYMTAGGDLLADKPAKDAPDFPFAGGSGAGVSVQHDADTSPLGDPVGMVSKVNLVELPCDEELRARLVAAAKKANLTVHEGIIATGDQFIHDGATRARIHHLFNALAVEMEGGAVAHTCLLNGVKCGVLRSISDQADGHSDMDYPTFTALAAAHSQQVVENLLRA